MTHESAALRMATETGPDAVVIEISGRMDAEGVRVIAPGFDHLHEAALPVIVDLTAVSAIDSLGVALLVRLAKSLRDAGTSMAVIPGDGRVARVLGLARVDRILNVVLTREAARRTLGLR